MNVAVLIAIEKYADPRMKSVPFAEADVRALADVLKRHAFAEMDQVVLLSEQATKSSIESRVARVLKGLGTEDELLFYYVGRVGHAGHTYLTCYDTVPQDLATTGIPLPWLCDRFKNSDCAKIAFFLDPHAGMPAGDDSRAPATDSPFSELEASFGSSERHACLVACKPGETSYSSGALKHGIWARHVMDAFARPAPAAVVQGTLLTTASLNKYLQREIPRTLTKTFATKKSQTPWMVGAGGYCLADLAEVPAQRNAPQDRGLGGVRNITLLSQRTRNIRSLSGYEKTFKQPDRVNAAADAFIARISTKEVTEDINAVFAQLKSAFKFRRADLHLTNQGDGAATIITPYFNYSIAVCLNRQETSHATFRRTVDAIKDFDRLGTPAFGRVFKDTFDTIEFDTPTVMDLPAFIDRIEEIDDGRIRVDYDPETTHCIVYMQGLAGTVKVTARTVSIVHLKPDLPENLVRSLNGFLAAVGQSLR